MKYMQLNFAFGTNRHHNHTSAWSLKLLMHVYNVYLEFQAKLHYIVGVKHCWHAFAADISSACFKNYTSS